MNPDGYNCHCFFKKFSSHKTYAYYLLTSPFKAKKQEASRIEIP